jgi:hypothetical protein
MKHSTAIRFEDREPVLTRDISNQGTCYVCGELMHAWRVPGHLPEAIVCHVCSEQITGTIYSFHGPYSFACEQCVRVYEQSKIDNFYFDEISESAKQELNQELACRKSVADHSLKELRRKYQRKIRAAWDRI